MVPGYGVERLSKLPKYVAPGSTISATLDLTQTTPYPLRENGGVDLLISVPRQAPQADISVRARNPVTGGWSTGVQETFDYGPNGEQVSFVFDDWFELPPSGHLVMQFELFFGPNAPRAYYSPGIMVAAIPQGAPPGESVTMESVGEGDEQPFQVGTAPPTTDVPSARVPATKARKTSTATASPTATVPSSPAASPVLPVAAGPLDTSSSAAPSPTPPVLANQVPVIRSTLIAPVVTGVVAVWLVLLAGYLYRARRRRRTAGPTVSN
jgi:hypothetical protein